MSVSEELVRLFNDEAESRDLIGYGAVWHEACLLGPSFTSNGRNGPGEKYTGEELSWDGKECDASVVVADRFVTLVFPKGENDALGPVLWGALSDPHMGDDMGKPLNGMVAAQLQHFCCDIANAGSPGISLFGQGLQDLLFGHRVYAAVGVCIGI